MRGRGDEAEWQDKPRRKEGNNKWGSYEGREPYKCMKEGKYEVAPKGKVKRTKGEGRE